MYNSFSAHYSLFFFNGNPNFFLQIQIEYFFKQFLHEKIFLSSKLTKLELIKIYIYIFDFNNISTFSALFDNV